MNWGIWMIGFGGWLKRDGLVEAPDDPVEGESDLTGLIIAAAIRVHQTLGPGFLESVYEEALCIELREMGLEVERQVLIVIRYRERPAGRHRLDLRVEGRVIVELKTVSGFEPIHTATLRSYLKAADRRIGLLLNFSALTLEIKRVGREWHSRR